MSTKTFISGIVAGIVIFFAGYLIYGIAMADYFTSNMPSYPGLTKDPMELWAIGVGNVIWGVLLAWILNSAGITSAGRGAFVGALVFFLLSLGMGLVGYGQMNMFSIQTLLVDAVCMAIITAAGGAVAGWMLGRPAKM
jgi:hypothetical protein